MKMVKLTWAYGQSHVEEGEDDAETLVEQTKTIILDAQAIRTFYARKPTPEGVPRPGTLVILRDKTRYPVTETVDQVEAAIRAACDSQPTAA